MIYISGRITGNKNWEKDFQKAEEYCKKEKERGTLMKISGVEPLVYKAYKNGYYESEKENKQLKQQITEAKENGVVLHNIRENPNDLPKVSGRYLVYTGGEPFILDFATEFNSFGYWVVSLGDDWGVRDEDFETVNDRGEDEVTAWCEIPKYMEE